MNRWLFLIAACCLWGCSDETSPDNGSTSTSTTASSSSSTTSSSGSGGDGGGGGSSTSTGTGGAGGAEPTNLVGCLDMYDTLPMPPNGTLPCEYIPPGLSLPQ